MKLYDFGPKMGKITKGFDLEQYLDRNKAMQYDSHSCVNEAKRRRVVD